MDAVAQGTLALVILTGLGLLLWFYWEAAKCLAELLLEACRHPPQIQEPSLNVVQRANARRKQLEKSRSQFEDATRKLFNTKDNKNV